MLYNLRHALAVMGLLMGFLFCYGFVFKIGKIGQPHPYTTPRLIFLVRQANFGQVVRRGRTWNPEVLTKTN